MADPKAAPRQRQSNQGDSNHEGNGSRGSTSGRPSLEQQQAELTLATGKASLRKAKASAKHAEAKADTAAHQAEQARHHARAEPLNQLTTQWERIVKLRLEATETWMLFWVTLLFLGVQATVSIASPGIYSFGPPVIYLGFVGRWLFRDNTSKRGTEEREDDP